MRANEDSFAQVSMLQFPGHSYSSAIVSRVLIPKAEYHNLPDGEFVWVWNIWFFEGLPFSLSERRGGGQSYSPSSCVGSNPFVALASDHGGHEFEDEAGVDMCHHQSNEDECNKPV